MIGSTGDDDVGSFSGSAYIFHYNGSDWLEQQKLTAADAAEGDQLGIDVSISGDAAVIGASQPLNGGPGAAYVYRFDGNDWIEEDKLTASDGAKADQFGWAVSIDGNVAVIGAPTDDDAGSASGSAYVFRFNGTEWIEEDKLTAPDAANTDLFGNTVSVSGDTAVIGAPFDDDDGFESGSAYVFRFNGKDWIEQAKLTASDAAEGDQLGIRVSINGDVAPIGANHFGNGGPGSAYVFNKPKAGWTDMTETAKLTASDGAAFDEFGWSVSISGDLAVIAAPRDDDAGSSSGSAYVFHFDGFDWIEQAKLTASDAAGGDIFGQAVSVSGESAVIGARLDDDGASSGSAYIFRSLGDCNENGELDLCDIVDGFSTDDNNNGIPDECECPWDLDGSGSVGASDLLSLLASWGPCKDCPADFNGDGNVGASDLLALLANWGPCP